MDVVGLVGEEGSGGYFIAILAHFYLHICFACL